MKLVKAYNSVSLVLRIVIGMVIGAALALLIPNAAVTAPGIGILGTLFVGALKAIAPLLVFVLIISFSLDWASSSAPSSCSTLSPRSLRLSSPSSRATCSP